MDNILGEDSRYLQASFTLAGRGFEQVLNRLDALLMVLKSCYGKECHEPWQTLHPNSKVKSIQQALDPDFDEFYADQPKVAFSSCELGYLKDAEGPQTVNAWDNQVALTMSEEQALGERQKTFEYHGPLEWWT